MTLNLWFKRLILALLFLSLANYAKAQEIITSYNNDTVSVLNEELRKINERITNATDNDTDNKAKVSTNDTLSWYLNGKLVAGNGISLTENNDGGYETLSIGVSGSTYANRQLYLSDDTFTAPAGVTLIYVSVMGSGGGGASTTDANTGGGGGGAGAYIIRQPYTVTPSSEYAVVVGIAGGGGTDADNFNAPGGTGQASSFDTVITANGGSGGSGANGGAGGAAQSAVTGDASTTTGGVISKIAGVAGGAGGNQNSGVSGGGGGSMAGSGPDGTLGQGVNATNYGTGGSGGGKTSAVTGGAGKQGFVLIEY